MLPFHCGREIFHFCSTSSSPNGRHKCLGDDCHDRNAGSLKRDKQQNQKEKINKVVQLDSKRWTNTLQLQTSTTSKCTFKVKVSKCRAFRDSEDSRDSFTNSKFPNQDSTLRAICLRRTAARRTLADIWPERLRPAARCCAKPVVSTLVRHRNTERVHSQQFSVYWAFFFLLRFCFWYIPVLQSLVRPSIRSFVRSSVRPSVRPADHSNCD